jgi:hypothetical protein
VLAVAGGDEPTAGPASTHRRSTRAHADRTL